MRRLWQHLSLRRDVATALASLGPRWLDRVCLFIVPFIMPVWQRVAWLRERWLHLRLEKLGHTFTCVTSDSSELFVLADVLCDEQYRLPESFYPHTILDLGSHIGASIIYFSLKYPEALIYGCEPHPDTFRKLQRNVGHLPNVRIFQFAVAATDGPVTLFEGPRSWSSSLRADWGGDERDQIVVQGKTIETILHDLRIASVDLIKIDVEGVECDVLGATPSPEARARVIIGEVHEFLPRLETEAIELEALLISRGYRWESRRYRTDRVFVATGDHVAVSRVNR